MSNEVLTLVPTSDAALHVPTHVSPEAEKLAEALTRVGNGDRAAFEDVYRRTSAKLFGVCVQVLPARTEAEEALQEVYLSVWRSAGSFDARRGTAMTWLITMARNRAIDRLRRSRRSPSVPIEMAGAVPDARPLAFDVIIADDERRRVHRCFDLLSTRDASALKMAFFGGATYADLAKAACVPVGTMKTRMRRALLQLRGGMARGGTDGY